MRKQSTVVVLEARKRVAPEDPEEYLPPFIEAANELGLVAAPHPLDKPEIRKVSTLLPATEMKTLLGPSFHLKKGTRSTATTHTTATGKAKVVQFGNPFQGMKQSTLKANQLVDAILTEDERWINVPDTYQDYKPSDFVMKLDCSKLQVLLL
jgi:hypothetical protein